MRLLAVLALCVTFLAAVTAAGKDYKGKYSKEANLPRTVEKPAKRESSSNEKDDYRPPKNYATSSERLFKMQKIQNIWNKGQKALNEAKLKALYHDLKTQDKQEIAFKKIKAQDKDGLQEAALRTQLSGIIERYALLSSFPEHKAQEDDDHKIDRMFKDKKLNKLWSKIEAAGLDEKEMKILKEELNHHQLKVDQYYALVDNLHETRDKTPEMENTIGHFLEDDDVVRSDKKQKKSKDSGKPSKKQNVDVVEEVRVKHQDLKEDFDALAEKIRSKLNEKEFENEKTSKLWQLAQKADVNKDELDSLRSELHHFDHRIRKLAHLTNELELKENADEAKSLKHKVAEFERKVDKSHDELRGRIARRSEL